MSGRVARLGLTLLAALVLGTALPAQAQLDFSIINPNQTAAPGETLTYHATLSNNTGTPVFLNGASVLFEGPIIGLDLAPFFLGFPASLAQSASVTGGILNVTLSPAAPPGAYNGAFSVLGGPGEFDADLLASGDFRVRVEGEVPVIPEPGSLALFAGGLAPMAALRRRRRSHRGCRA